MPFQKKITPTVPISTNTPTQINEPANMSQIIKRIDELEAKNKILESKLREANGDISESIQKSKRKYWYNIDWTRKKDELFKYKYNTIMIGQIEKAVKEVKTIWRPTNILNHNTGKWTNKHDVEVTFIDWNKEVMDILEYLDTKKLNEEYVSENDIRREELETYYTFRTKQFWDFDINQKFIN